MRKGEQTVYEVSLLTPSDDPVMADILEGILVSLGLKLKEISEHFGDDCRRVSFYMNTLAQAGRFRRTIERLKLKKLSCEVKKLTRQDWLEKWKSDFKPFKLTPRLAVVPTWLKKKHKTNNRECIYIDTVSAFGTGLHETTRFMSEFIDAYRGRFDSFLDIGTGSGILAMVARRSGSKDIVAIDNDPDCVRAARQNFKENNLTCKKLLVGNVHHVKLNRAFDFVAANLFTTELLKLNKKLLGYVKKGKYLAISGISLENLSSIKKKYSALPIRCLRIKKGKKWAALLYKRT